MKKRIIILCALLLFCISITACSSEDSNKNHYIKENNDTNATQDNNGTNATEETSSNGYSSIDAIVAFYIRSHTGQTVSKVEVQRMYPQEVWDNWQDYRDFSLDDTYASLQKNTEKVSEKYSSKYGSNYVITYNIIETVEKAEGIYEVAVEVNIEGELRCETVTNYISVRKIGDKWYGY